MGSFNNILDSLRNWWQTASPVTRASATGMGLLILAGMVFAVSLATSPDYKTIYSGVAGKDASSIQSTLTEHGIQMKYNAGDNTISVPSKDASNAMMYIESADILDKNAKIVGMESLDKITMGTSSAVERLRLQTAQEGELDRTLMRIDGVAMADVHIAAGSNASLFGNDTPPTASVMLTLKPGQTMSPGQIKGVAGLVAASISGMTDKQVKISDQTGNQLWGSDGLGTDALGDGQPLNQSAKYAEMVRQQIQQRLDETLGVNRSKVNVIADLDFDQTQTHTIEHNLPVGMKTPMPVSVQESNESYSGAGAPQSGGVAGSGSNLSTPSYGAGGTQSGNYKNSKTLTNYDPGTSDTVTQKAPGSVRALSVAALIDSKISPADVANLKTWMAGAIGAAPGVANRVVTVSQIPFDTSAQQAQDAQVKAIMAEQMWTNIAKALGACVFGCVLLYILAKSSQRSGAGEPRLAMVGGGGHIGMLEDTPEADLDALLEERPLRVEDVLAEMPEVSPRRQKRRMNAPSIEEHQDLKMESIQDMVNSNSESVALLLKGWMSEDTPATR
ncbi:flagellar M-ring protein [Capsulimonas corticalis]|uniref:Flagellar M-ring protein n=1 Tax=Capsulimonas corticalis TaxID=2219043 RepID=A0A402CSY6_9BACT|nr:flagellar basal-body MS-ring/collar protein FliF [Capsulimonas corticalis]BDI30917.1 flagellar M-ring protein [Capsulimonas corticalis]